MAVPAILVQKYGGSSVADAAALTQVAAAVVDARRRGYALVVVVSAMGKTTDALIAQARAVTFEPPQRELDMLVSAGERISMALLSMAIIGLGAQAISFTGSQSGIITNNQHQGARILEVRPDRILAALAAGKIVICAGYQGVSLAREVTTLGRGGSDTTAIALAAALGAEACEIYSDVDGVYSGDPRVCPQAHLLADLPYETMQTLAGFGARVVCAEAVCFAQAAGIAVSTRKTGDDSGRHSCIHAAAPRPRGPVAVTSLMQASVLHGALGGLPAAFWQQLDAGRARLVATGAQQALLDRSAMATSEPSVIDTLAHGYGLRAEHGATVALVGNDLMAEVHGAWRASLARQLPGAQPLFCSDQALVAFLDVARADHGVRLMHHLYCETM